MALNKRSRQSGVLLPERLGRCDVCMKKTCSSLKDVADADAVCRGLGALCVLGLSGPRVLLCVRITRKACSTDSPVPSPELLVQLVQGGA